MLLRQLRRSIALRPALATPHLCFFAKEAPKKEGGKKAEAPPSPPVPEEPKLQDLVVKWIKPTHTPLSPTQQKCLAQGFEDLSASDKQILEGVADRILELPTAVLMDIIKKGALGTTNMYYTAVEPLAEDQVAEAIKHLRKEI